MRGVHDVHAFSYVCASDAYVYIERLERERVESHSVKGVHTMNTEHTSDGKRKGFYGDANL